MNVLGIFVIFTAHAATPCLPGTVPVGPKSEVCMDEFEAPNIKGRKPFTAWNAFEGEKWCAEHGKRLCTEAEWVAACQESSAGRRNYPYGDRYQHHRCNQDKEWIKPDWRLVGKYPAPEGRNEVERLNQSESSGSRPGCVSEGGVYDLTGNVAEWVRRSFQNRTNYSHVLKGCYWAGCYGGSRPNCTFVNPAHPGKFRTYEAGFRCCTPRVN